MTVPPGYHYMQPPDPMRPRVRFEAIGEAWNLFTQQIGPWIGATLILLAPGGLLYIAWMFWLLFVGALVTPPASRGGPPPIPDLGLMIVLFSLFGIAVGLLATFLLTGMYRMAVRQVQGERIAVGDVFSVSDVWLRALGAFLLVGLVTCVGFFLLILPAYIFSGLLMCTLPLIVDKRLGVMEAMQRSWDTLKKEWLMAALFYFVINIVAGLGVYLLFIGILFTYPLMFLAQAIVYRDFFLTPQMAQAPPPAAFDLPPAGTEPLPPPPDAPTG